MNKVYKVLIIINFLMGVFTLWWIFGQRVTLIAEIYIRTWNLDYCAQKVEYDPEKVKECWYEYDFHFCRISNATGSEIDYLEVARCQKALEKPASFK